MKREEKKTAIRGITMDDCLFAATKHEAWIKEHVKILCKAFGEVTVSRGDYLGIVGIQLRMDRKKKIAILSQPKWEKKVIKEFKVGRKAPDPVLADLMGEDEESDILKIYAAEFSDDVWCYKNISRNTACNY